MPAFEEQTIVVAGLGLLGGSLAGALKTRFPKGPRVLAWARRQASIDEARARGWIDYGSTDPAGVLREADLTVLCIPPVPTVAFACRQAALWREGSLVTDVGSVKAEIVRGVRPVLANRGVAFIGSHPMAGSEQTGIAHADPDLFAGATVFLTPLPEDDPEQIAAVENFWTRVGGQSAVIEAERHDAVTARTSHVLHLLAAGLVQALLESDPMVEQAAAGAFRDMTRVASSSADMWTQISRQNTGNILDALDEVQREATHLKTLILAERWRELQQYLREAGDRRREWGERHKRQPNPIK